MSQQSIVIKKADYGLDAPGLVRNFLLYGGICAAVGLGGFLWASAMPGNSIVLNLLGNITVFLFISGVLCCISGSLMVWSSRYGKLRKRDLLLDSLQLRGDETVLDVGCGRGLLLLGAARRLPEGRVWGLDLWSQVDLSNNSKAATLANATAEGVSERVEIYDGDMQQMPFANESVDIVVANLSIHNIYKRDGRRKAIVEIARVLKRGGRVALMDFKHVKEYGEDLQAIGLKNVKVSGMSFWIYPPVRVVTGEKE